LILFKSDPFFDRRFLRNLIYKALIRVHSREFAAKNINSLKARTDAGRSGIKDQQ